MNGEIHEHETETKFLAPGPEALDGLDDALRSDGEQVESRGEVDLRDTYFDTEDWWFFRAGVACRIRRQQGANGRPGGITLTLKELAEPAESLARRFELSEILAGEVPETPSDPPGDSLGARLRHMLAGRVLRPLFEIRNRRRLFELTGDGLRAEVARDQAVCRPLANPGHEQLFNELELESIAGEPAVLRTVSERIAHRLGLRPSGQSKFERGLKLTGLVPPLAPLADGPTIRPRERTIDAAWRIIGHQLALIRWYEPGTALGLDVECLHQMRVSTRRLRAALRMFARPLGQALCDDLREHLGWLADVLGAVRDLDVYLLNLPEYARHLDSEHSDMLDGFRDHLHARRGPASEAMLEALRSPRYAKLMSRLEHLVAGGPPADPTDPDADTPIAVYARKRVRHLLRKVRGLGGAALPKSPDEQLHELRLAVKRLRYNCEFVASLAPKPAAKFIRRCKKLQDALGDVQDARVAGDVLMAYADAAQVNEDGNGRRADLDALLAWQERIGRSRRREFFKLWRKFARPKARKPLLGALRKQAKKA